MSWKREQSHNTGYLIGAHYDTITHITVKVLVKFDNLQLLFKSSQNTLKFLLKLKLQYII